MNKRRSSEQEQIADLLLTARSALGLSVTFLTRMDGVTQHLEVVEGAGPLMPLLFQEGYQQRQDRTLCQAILDRKLPPVIGDLKDHPEAMKLPAARFPHIRSFVSAPVVLSDGSLYGTFCGAGLSSDKGLTDRDKSLMDVLAHATAMILEPGVVERARVTEVEGRLLPVMHAGGPVVVLQPIVDLASGVRIGAEALSRFPADWRKAPDICFAEAHSVGLGDAMELLALAGAGRHLPDVSGYVAMNVSPATLLTAACTELLAALPLDRVLLELSEHDAVENYDALRAVLEPLRARGMRLAIDDVGAGFSSLRHIVLTTPDVIKLDRSIVDGVGHDPVLRTLVRSLVDFGHGCNARVVAEGVETEADAVTLLQLEVDYGQGWHFGRPGPAEALTAAMPVPPSSGETGTASVPEPRRGSVAQTPTSLRLDGRM